MASTPLTHVVGHLRRSVQADAGLTDGQLLDAYISRRDEAAFECLVWRHGPAVLGVCRRVLTNEADAEDAFQATFLVLIRKAHTVRPRQSVGAWLYGVACNVARKARADADRRRAKEWLSAQFPKPESADADLRPAIDLEVNRLPEKYRVPIVLCELEEQPIAEAAKQLGWPQGTVASRLARGREILGRRLARHGLCLSGLAAATLTAESVAAVMSAGRSNGGPSGRLAESVVQGMMMAKAKTVFVAIICTVLVLVGGIAFRMATGERTDPQKPAEPPKVEPVKADPPKPKSNPLLGRWKLLKQVYNGEAMEPPGVRRMVVTDGTMRIFGIGVSAPIYVWKANPDASPATLDLSEAIVGARAPRQANAIYKLEGDTLTIAAYNLLIRGVPANEKLDGRPKEFGGKDTLVLTFERDTAVKADFERFMGRWRVLSGGPYKVIEFREQPHQGLMIAENDKHEADWFSWIIDERKDPRQIDVIARVEGKSNPNHGIYKFDGERLVIYLGAPLRFQGDPGKHTRPGSFAIWEDPGENYLLLERETVAWGKVFEDGLQFGVEALPRGRMSIEFTEIVEFRILVRNTTNKAIDVDLPRTDGNPPGWMFSVRDSAGKVVPLHGPVPIPGAPLPFSRLKAKLVDYQIGEIGKYSVRFVAPAPGWIANAAKVDLGEHTIRFTSYGSPKDERVTGDLKLAVVDTAAWGKPVRGVSFALALAKGQSPKIHIGERARFRILARNTTDKPVTAGTLQVLHLPMFAEPKVSGKGDVKDLPVRFTRGPNVSPPPTNLKLGPNETVELPGEFVLPFLPHEAQGETHVIAREGKWTLSIPNLDTWTAGSGWGTADLDIEIVPGNVAHTDSQRIAWGPIADGLQFGLRPDKVEYEIGDTVKFAVHARNMSDKAITFRFPTLHGWWPNNGRPVIKDADGKDMKPLLAVPPGPIGPQAVTEHTVKPGETIEVVIVSWLFVERDLPGMYKVDHVVLEKPGICTFMYPDLHAKVKPAWPTGAARLTFKTPEVLGKDAVAKPDAERILGPWTVIGETLGGKPVKDRKYPVLEFRAQKEQGLLIARDAAGREHWFTWKIDEKQLPKTIDLWARVPGFSNPNHGVYEFKGARLRIGLGAPLRFDGNPGEHTRPATVDAAVHILELEESPIAWGTEKDGLQFGLAPASGQSGTVRLGESVRLLVYVRNTSDSAREYEARKLDVLPAYVGVRLSRGDRVLKTVLALPPGGLPKPDKFAVAAKAFETVGEFKVPILATEDRQAGAHVVGDIGKWDVDIPDLNGWLTLSGYSTGRVAIEIVR
jgi:RNA polymerase sigma factor (sigma-70 family)